MAQRPPHLVSIGTIIDSNTGIVVWCSGCFGRAVLSTQQLEQIAAAKGRDFDLWNRRTRCRLKPGCDGWNFFRYQGQCDLDLCDPGWWQNVLEADRSVAPRPKW